MLIERFIEDPHHIEIQVSECSTKYGDRHYVLDRYTDIVNSIFTVP